MKPIKASYSEFIDYKNSTEASIHFLETDQDYILYLSNGNFQLETYIEKTDPRNEDQVNFEDNYKNLPSTNSKIETAPSPFASKSLKGSKLFQRVHGQAQPLTTSQNTFEFAIPYPQVKFNEIEIIGAEVGDSCNLNILDSETGLVSTIPNLKLNQFGFNVNIAPTYYQRKSNYDADLYGGMKISVEYNSISDKTVYINYILHEIK